MRECRKTNNRNENIFKMVPQLIVVLILALILGISAKYISERPHEDNQAKADKFYFTVDLLGDTNAENELEGTYDICGGGQKEVTFSVKNYFDSLRITETDVKYKVSVESSNTYNSFSLTCAEASVDVNEEITMSKSVGAKSHAYTLTMNEGYADGTVITVTIASSAPYQKTMKLHFVLNTVGAAVTYRVEDAPGVAYATLIIMTNVDIDAEGIMVDWSNINQAENILQVDTTNPYVLDADLKLTGKNAIPLKGYLSKIYTTQEMVVGESISIYFFKTDKSANYSKGSETTPIIAEKNGVYEVFIGN